MIHDDFTDSSHTRHDQPCWFRVPKVGIIALNDAVLLLAHIPRILKKHFREKPYYVDLLHLFNKVMIYMFWIIIKYFLIGYCSNFEINSSGF